jgi:hypothetical protein
MVIIVINGLSPLCFANPVHGTDKDFGDGYTIQESRLASSLILHVFGFNHEFLHQPSSAPIFTMNCLLLCHLLQLLVPTFLHCLLLSCFLTLLHCVYQSDDFHPEGKTTQGILAATPNRPASRRGFEHHVQDGSTCLLIPIASIC